MFCSAFLGFVSILLSLVISLSIFLLPLPGHFIVHCSFTACFTAPFRTEAHKELENFLWRVGRNSWGTGEENMDTIQTLLILLAFSCKIPSDWQPKCFTQLHKQKWGHKHKNFGGTGVCSLRVGRSLVHTPETLALCLQPEAAVRAPEEMGPCSSRGRNQT